MPATEAHFRTLALALPGTEEREHMDHPDFRVKGRIFATLSSPEPGWAMVKLTPEQQAAYLKAKPKAFLPAAGKWGERGATHIHLTLIDRTTLRRALLVAWRNTAPEQMVRDLGPPS